MSTDVIFGKIFTKIRSVVFTWSCYKDRQTNRHTNKQTPGIT